MSYNQGVKMTTVTISIWLLSVLVPFIIMKWLTTGVVEAADVTLFDHWKARLISLVIWFGYTAISLILNILSAETQIIWQILIGWLLPVASITVVSYLFIRIRCAF
jgi:hypothetical protein